MLRAPAAPCFVRQGLTYAIQASASMVVLWREKRNPAVAARLCGPIIEAAMQCFLRRCNAGTNESKHAPYKQSISPWYRRFDIRLAFPCRHSDFSFHNPAVFSSVPCV